MTVGEYGSLLVELTSDSQVFLWCYLIKDPPETPKAFIYADMCIAKSILEQVQLSISSEEDRKKNLICKEFWVKSTATINNHTMQIFALIPWCDDSLNFSNRRNLYGHLTEILHITTYLKPVYIHILLREVG